MKTGIGAVAILWLASAGAWAQPGSQHYLYLSDKRIVTVELIDAESLILNYINLSDTIEFVRAPHVVVLDARGEAFRGHLIEDEEPATAFDRYSVTDMVDPGEFKGYTIKGRFDFQAPPTRCLVKETGQILELEPLTADDFELAAQRIGTLELDMADRAAMIQQAGFYQGHGEQIRTSQQRYQEVNALFPDLDLLPPVLIHNPRPALPEDQENVKDPAVVTIECDVSRGGGMFNFTVKQGINKRLDKLAVEYVQNTWRILPAIANSKTANAKTTINVLFERE